MGGVRKAFMAIAGKPMLQYSVDAFLAHPFVVRIAVALSADDARDPPQWLKNDRIILTTGGEERADSVRACIEALGEYVDAVIIHDAARPLLEKTLIDRVLVPLQQGSGATVGVAATDTLHVVDAGHAIETTLDRSRVWRAQTPQAFPRNMLEHAYAASSNISQATDEAGLVAAAGFPVVVVPGEAWNVKVTTRHDVDIVEAILRGRPA